MAADAQIDLELWPREHDLPPRWDGLIVEWNQWSDTEHIFVCPPPRPRPCSRCKSTRPPHINAGRLWTDPAAAPASISRGRLLAGRHFIGMINAFRCPECQHDSVLDANGQTWDLDPTDYTDNGSCDNTTLNPSLHPD